jgi:hypothetical protein
MATARTTSKGSDIVGKPVADIKVQDLYFVCDDPDCDLAKGSLGMTSEEIRARVQALAAESDEDEDDDEAEADPLDDEDDSDIEDPGDPTAIDPLGEGAPCPLCRAVDPPRKGKLLAVPVGGSLAGVVAARVGSLGLKYWGGISSDSISGINRLIDAQRNAAGDPTRSKATNSFVVGRKAMTAVILKEMPFDGHMLCYGNEDSKVWGIGDIPKAKGKGTRRGSTWISGAAKYGIDHGPPSSAARANPVYVRELQEDLFWLGYLSLRGDPTAGRFDHHTLGAVLGFKQDLADVYGIATSPVPLPVAPGSVRAADFTTAIWSQPHFVAPVRIMLDWAKVLLGGKKRPGSVVQAIKTHAGRLARAKSAKAAKAPLAALTARHAVLDGFAAGWPRLAALEDVTQPFLPFAPRDALNAVDQLAPVPPGKQPKHPTAAALIDDPVWQGGAFHARAQNKAKFIPRLTAMCKELGKALASIAEAQAELATVAVPAEHAADWAVTRPALAQALARLEKVLTLVQYWVLDSPVQIAAWLKHIVVMGTVDQATAVYLKALREGGKIGPNRRLGYQLQRLGTADEFADRDVSAMFLREECTSRTPNKPGAKCSTMPEIFALQFFGNESGLKFTRQLKEFSTRPEDADARLVVLGIDTNSHRKGVFDAVYHQGGVWLWSRGWGVGQATDVDSVLDGVELRRGLPIMPADAETVRHPRAYVDRFESVRDAMQRKVLPRYDHSNRRDCSFGKAGGDYYDCHTCLKRFCDSGATGTAPYGRGGVFVPTGGGTVGNINRAAGFFVDFERYTAFTREKDALPDPDAVKDYEKYFGLVLPRAEAPVARVLQALGAEGVLTAAVAAVAKEMKGAGQPAVDEASLLASVQAHIAVRTQLPCSWLHVRIRYAGTGEQAYQSLHTMIHVIGELKAKNVTVNKHVKEASERRRNP